MLFFIRWIVFEVNRIEYFQFHLVALYLTYKLSLHVLAIVAIALGQILIIFAANFHILITEVGQC